jgi:hypothetical protein
MNKLIIAALAAALTPQSASAVLVGLYQFNDAADLGRKSGGAGNHAASAGATFAKAGHQGGAATLQAGAFLTVPIDAGVPEPETWATLVAGFGFIGLTMRRRRRVPSVAA